MTILIAGDALVAVSSLSQHGRMLNEYDSSIKQWLVSNISGEEYYSFESEAQMFSLLLHNLLSTTFIYQEKLDVICTVDKFYDIDEILLVSLSAVHTSDGVSERNLGNNSEDSSENTSESSSASSIAVQDASGNSKEDSTQSALADTTKILTANNLITVKQLDDVYLWLKKYYFFNLGFLGYLSVELRDFLASWLDFSNDYSCLDNENTLKWIQENSKSAAQFCYNLNSIQSLYDGYFGNVKDSDPSSSDEVTTSDTDVADQLSSNAVNSSKIEDYEKLLTLKKTLDTNVITTLLSMLASPLVASAPDQKQLQEIIAHWYRDQPWLGFDTIYDGALVMLKKVGVKNLLDKNFDLYIKDQMGQIRTLLTSTNAVAALKAQFNDGWDYYYQFDNKELIISYFNQSLFVKSWQ